MSREKTELVDPLSEVQTAAPLIRLGTKCPRCGQTMTAAYSSGKRVAFCEKDGLALPEKHADDTG